MGETPKFTESADKIYLYGTAEEVASRLEGGMGPTESHFSQIRPTTGSQGASAKQKGDTRNNRAKIQHRG